MKNIILFIAVFSINCFFIFSGILGLEFNDSNSNLVYIAYNFFIAIIIYIIYLKHITNYGLTSRLEPLIYFLIPYSIILLFFLGILFKGYLGNQEAIWFGYFILWSVPAILTAIIIDNENRYLSFNRLIEFFMLIASLNNILTILLPALWGTYDRSISLLNYQAASYIAAFSFGLSIYFLFFNKNHTNFSFLRNKLYLLFLSIISIFNLISVILPGGRGALVLSVLYLLLTILFLLKFKYYKSLLYIVMVLTIFYFSFPTLLNNSSINTGFKRATEFLGDGLRINWAGTSDRDLVYSNVISLISENPIWGYGIFSYWNYSPNPHNIFLEFMLSGGILYSGLMSIVLLLIIFKVFRLIKFNSSDLIYLYILIFPLTILMFSGSYLITSEFWFITTLILLKSRKAIKVEIK